MGFPNGELTTPADQPGHSSYIEAIQSSRRISALSDSGQPESGDQTLFLSIQVAMAFPMAGPESS